MWDEEPIHARWTTTLTVMRTRRVMRWKRVQRWRSRRRNDGDDDNDDGDGGLVIEGSHRHARHISKLDSYLIQSNNISWRQFITNILFACYFFPCPTCCTSGRDGILITFLNFSKISLPSPLLGLKLHTSPSLRTRTLIGTSQ